MKQISKWFMAMVMITGLALAGCGDDKEGDKKGSDKKEGDKSGASVETDSKTASTTPPATGEITTVKLDLPHMTWGGCVTQVREALTGVSDFSDVELDASSKSGSFKVAKGFDVQAKLDELAKSAGKMKDFSIQ